MLLPGHFLSQPHSWQRHTTNITQNIRPAQWCMAAGELAFDMSWPAVRTAVLEGLTLLVDNPHAQPVLKKALPQLACLLNDPALRVSAAVHWQHTQHAGHIPSQHSILKHCSECTKIDLNIDASLTVQHERPAMCSGVG